MSKTYTITLEFEVKMTSPGYPATGPSYSSGGEPPEGPELEIERCSFEGDTTFIETLHKRHIADKKSRGVEPDSFDQFFADQIYDKVLEKAYSDDWSDDQEDYDPTSY